MTVAGPIAGNDEIAGISIYRVGSVEKARALAENDPAVRAGRHAVRVVKWAGAILNASGSERGTPVVGVTNLFSRSGAVATAWPGCLTMTRAHFPGAAVVGYESREELTVARGHGFHAVGPLRVWKRED
jgi:hypothetical protein